MVEHTFISSTQEAEAGKVELEVGSWGGHVSKYKQKAEIELGMEHGFKILKLISVTHFLQQDYTSRIYPYQVGISVQTPEHVRAILIHIREEGNSNCEDGCGGQQTLGNS